MNKRGGCKGCGAERPKETEWGSPYKSRYCLECRKSGVRKTSKGLSHDQLASYLARKYPEYVNIVYECCHDKKKKSLHHFDENRPFDVIKLCYSCHKQEHSRQKNGAGKNTRQ